MFLVHSHWSNSGTQVGAAHETRQAAMVEAIEMVADWALHWGAGEDEARIVDGKWSSAEDWLEIIER